MKWARLMPWLLLAGLGLCIWWWRRASDGVGAAAAARRTFRPSARRSPHPPAAAPSNAAADTVHVMRRAEVQGLRDAYSSAAIDPAAPLWACPNCQALYHAASLEALRVHNEGRCASCGHKAFAPVHFSD